MRNKGMKKDSFEKIAEDHRKYINNLENIISFEEFDEALEKQSELLDFIDDSAYRNPAK